MDISRLTYRQTGFFSPLIADYIDEHVNTTALYSFPFSLQGFKKAIEYRKNKPVNRGALLTAIEKQYTQGNTTPSAKTAENIALLKDEYTFTIVTGHQLCLFTGPLYLIYKLIDTIILAAQLKQQFPLYNFVPVYWMHTEDGDIEEINHTYLFNKKLHWADAGQGAAGMLSTQTIQPVIDELATLLGDSEQAKELLALVKESYLNHTNLADATRHFVNTLLGNYGLVILDPNERELKSEFSSILEDEFTNASAHKLVNQTNAQLVQQGYTAQVNPRELNLFYINKGLRYRLVKTDNGFATAANEFTFTAEEISKLIKETPEVFSPNVVLRPLYQEVILPNICYVGGGGELAYWLQYKAFFNHYKYELPVLALRSSYLIVEGAQATRMQKFGFDAAAIFDSADNLVKRYLQTTGGDELSLSAERGEAAAFYAKLSAKAALTDTTLTGSIEAENKKLENFLNGLEAKLLKAQKTKDEATVNQIRKLKESLFPEGTLQERYTNFMQFYLKQGPAFFDTILANAAIMEKKFTVVTLPQNK